MAYIVPIHKASSIRHGLKAKFLYEDRNALIVAKSNRIEVYDIIEDGIVLQTHFTIYGRITALLSLRPETSTLDHLFIATDRYDYLTVSWNAEKGTIQNERRATDITDKFQRPASFGPLYLADPGGRMLGLYLYEGIFTAIPFVRPTKKGKKQANVSGPILSEIGNLDEPRPIRIKELKVITMQFLYVTTEKNPVVAMLYKDARDSVHLKTYEVVPFQSGVSDASLVDWTIKDSNLEQRANILIPVPHYGGLLVLGEQVISYYHQDRSQPMRRPLHEATTFQTYGMIDSTKYMLGDEWGKLHLLLLVVEDGKVKRMKIEKLGQTSQATCLVYLDNQCAFIGSHFGDAQLVKLSPTEPRLELVSSLTNLAPISDFSVIGMDVGGVEVHQYSSGQTKVLTCSGGFFDGGLRSVSSGVGLEEFGVLGDMTGVRGLWTLKTKASSNFDDTLVLSFVDETRVLSFDSDGEIEELEEYNQFSFTEKTLVATNVGHDRLLQVTPSKVYLVDRESSTVLSEWSPSGGSHINIAECNEDTLMLVIDGKNILLFDIQGESILEKGSRIFDHEVSCIAIPESPTRICAAGFWSSSACAVMSSPTLETISEDRLAGVEGVVPRSIIIAKVMKERPPVLFVAMGDGSLYTFAVSNDTGALSEKKSIILGTQAISFQALPRKDFAGVHSIFAICDHPTLIYGEEGKIVYSAVTADKATFVASLNAEAYPQSVVIASEEEIRIAKIDDARTSHTQTLPLKQFARRVAFSKQKRIFGTGTIRNMIDETTGMEISNCYFQLVDETVFSPIDTYKLFNDELVECLVCLELPNSDGTFSDKFVLGTSIGNDTDTESEKGRLLIFELGEDKVIRLELEKELKGNCYSLNVLEGKLVVGQSRTIDVYKFIYPSPSKPPQLLKVASARVASVPVSIAVQKNQVFVGDLMKGVMVLEYQPGIDGLDDTLKEVCRQYAISWVTAVEAIDDETCISADADTNIMILKKNPNGVTEEDQRRMQCISEMRLGEMVNKIRRVNEPQMANATVFPQAYLATVEGSLYLLGLIDPKYQDLLMKFQSNLAHRIKGVGDLEFDRYRAYCAKGRTPEEPFRFVDGDLVEKFLDLDPETQDLVIKGRKESDQLDCSVEQMKDIVEALKRLH